MKKPVFPTRVKKGFEVIRRTHIHSGEVMYVQVHITRQKPLNYYTASTEFDFMQVKDHQQEKDWIIQNFAEAVPTRNSVVVEPAEKKDVKDMTLVEMITAGLTEDQVNKELNRRKKNKANKKYKAAQKAKKEKAEIKE